MNRRFPSLHIAFRMWLLSALILSLGINIYLCISESDYRILIFPAAFIVATIGSFPAFIALAIFQPLIKKQIDTYRNRITAQFILLFIIALIYGIGGFVIFHNLFDIHAWFNSLLLTAGLYIASVFSASLIAFFININHFRNYFQSTFNTINMQDKQLSASAAVQQTYSNRLWIKGLITAALILLMLIPTVFVSNLVDERQARQQEVKNEVSSKWAGQQDITFPYLYIPYTTTTLENNKAVSTKKSFIILPEALNVNGNIVTQQRQRSIYTVLLYNSSVNAKGYYKIQIPSSVDSASINWNEAKICMGISDFKGLEQKVTVKFNNASYDLLAGLPSGEIDSTGLSAPVALTNENIGKEISFELPLKIKGSDELHFAPLAGNSHFTISSSWNSPSFDGNTLPSERILSNDGFEANWNFINANLPFNTSFEHFNFKKDDYTFGVSLLQPTDQYAKTLRCLKYAILFIGLTFSLFFIVEIMQKKPFHPVQYVLVGLALVIFFTLLLSISEFLLFDAAYVIAASATISLITLYAKSHFNNWKIAGLFAGVIGSIYGFIFVLIRLEDTALLVGSIGLFVILALAMYASRKINWYGNNLTENVSL